MFRVLLMILAVVSFTSPTLAKDWSGHWVVRSDTTPLFSFEIESRGGTTIASWARPKHFSLNEAGLSDLQGPVINLPAAKLVDSGDALSLTFRKPGTTDDTRFILRAREGNLAKVELADLPPGFILEPFDVSRESTAPVFTEWRPSAMYRFNRSYPNNPEMKAIFEADQAARTVDKIDWKKLGLEDAARLKRTRELLNANALNSGADFYYASFIFQHGSDPNDYLLAHLLAMAASARGYDASWIGAATLDRYLQKIGGAQVFGTQYSKPSDGHWTQSPYNADLIPDSLRKAVGVPDRKSQDDKLKTMK